MEDLRERAIRFWIESDIARWGKLTWDDSSAPWEAFLPETGRLRLDGWEFEWYDGEDEINFRTPEGEYGDVTFTEIKAQGGDIEIG